MSTIRPTDLPEVRADLINYQLVHGPAYFELAPPLSIRGDTKAAARHFAEAEAERLMRADLFWVNSQMAMLAAEAYKTMPDFALAPEDLPGPWGFMAFESPIHVVEGSTGQIPIIAVSWGPCNEPEFGYNAGGIWMSWYTDPSVLLDSGKGSNAIRNMIRVASPPLLYGSVSIAPYSKVEVPSGDTHGGPAHPDALSVYVLKAIWLLMNQDLTVSSTSEPDRAARKRMRRIGQEPRPVRLIELRRPKASGNAGDGDREYYHQWIVRGHWRQHWYPKRQVHRPVWIAPHIKGPEGAPLIGGEKVHVLKADSTPAPSDTEPSE